MIPARAEIAASIGGGARLLCFRSQGLQHLSPDGGAPLRSFFALVVTLPAYLFLLVELRQEIGLEQDDFHFYGVWLLTYLILWTAFPVLLLSFSQRFPFHAKVPFFIQATNWFAVPASYAKLASDWLSESAVLPQGFGEFINVAAVAWLLVAQWWLARRTLDISGGQAAALVFFSELLNYAIFAWAVTRTAMPLLPQG